MKPGEEQKDGPPIHGNTRLEVVWTALPTVLIIGLVSYAYVVLRNNEEHKAGAITVNVTERQFAFEFSYNSGGKQVVSSDLYLAKDQPVVFKLHSLDVIHSFFVPEFSVKLDAVPGITTTMRVTPIRTGNYPAECTELCGAGHALMRAPVHVLTRSAFQSWLAAQKANTAPPIGTPPPNTIGSGIPGAGSAAAAPSSGGSSGGSSSGGSSSSSASSGSASLSPTAQAGKAVFTGALGLRHVPHAGGRRHERYGRAEPWHGGRSGLQEGRTAAEAVHPGIDHRSEQVHRARFPAERHASDVRQVAVLDADH